MSKALLRSITLRRGSLRGINSLDIKFEYPIVAFAGVNGAGKSTILAMACCAFHNKPKGFKLPRRKNTYYTFSDFFIQHSKEVAPQGIEIDYKIAYNNWTPAEEVPTGIGIATQARWKQKGGKWNDYAGRVPRNVVFLGIERIVPHSERSQSKSYSRSFKDVPTKGWEDDVMSAVGAILGKKYDEFRYTEHSKYSLPLVRCGDVIYSGFNMGAGENALFEIFSNIYSAGDGALLVLDEVELGLHSRAQRMFMKKLKEVCKKTNTQIICTTHSREIFESLPDDARFFVESVQGKTRITSGVSPEFAFSRMGAVLKYEATVLVEDDVARAILQECLAADVRTRIQIKVVGSASALSRQLAAAYVRKEDRPTISVFDGDQRVLENRNLSHAKKMAETVSEEFGAWFRA
ncbi:ATP-dependent nuclease, partial [Stenotrophomonas sp. P5_B8]